MSLDNLVVIGITGGIGSGKTQAANIFESEGYPVIYTDDLAKEIMDNNELIQNALCDVFGDSICSNGIIDKKNLASIVFGESDKSSSELKKLNQIVHPAVIDEMMTRIQKAGESGIELIFVESALIYEIGLDAGFDYVIVINAGEQIRIDRTLKRGGLNEEQIRKRMSEQISMEEKIKRADFSIDNNGDLDDLKRAVVFLMPILASLPPNNFEDEDEDEETE